MDDELIALLYRLVVAVEVIAQAVIDMDKDEEATDE